MMFCSNLLDFHFGYGDADEQKISARYNLEIFLAIGNPKVSLWLSATGHPQSGSGLKSKSPLRATLLIPLEHGEPRRKDYGEG